MTVQVRFEKNDPRLYNVERDVAHNFRFVAMEVAKRLERKPWPELDLALKHVPDDPQLGQAAQAFCTFVATAALTPTEDMSAALLRSGWFAVPPSAQVAYMAYLGQVMAGVYFHGVREATIGGQGPCSQVDDLLAAGREASRFMSIPRYRRPWARVRQRLQEALRAFRKPNPRS